MQYLATKYEILVKTEPFLKFKKELFKDFVKKSGRSKEEILRRKFYKILDLYLSDKEVAKTDFKKINIKFLLKKLDNRFKKINEGSFVIQGYNVGYVKNGTVAWIRYYEDYNNLGVKSFL